MTFPRRTVIKTHRFESEKRPSYLDLVTLLRQQWHECPQAVAVLGSQSNYQQMILSAAA
jgi:hypothetical protein